jgi:hypothetical protein
MYRAMAQQLECKEIGLCKETRMAWREMGLDAIRHKCNCTI